MARVTTPSGITVDFETPDDLTWGEAKEITRRMNSATPEDVEYALAVMLKGWEGQIVANLKPPKITYSADPADEQSYTVHANGLTRIKMRHVNEILEVMMAAVTAEGKASETGI